MASACSLLVPRTARAEWAKLGWDECGAGILARQFACDTNVGQARIIVSAVRDSVGFFTLGVTSSLDIYLAAGQPLPWWQVAVSGCRSGALTTSGLWHPEDTRCLDLWSGVLSTGLFVTMHDGPPRLELHAVGGDPTDSAVMQPFIETFIMSIDVHFNKSAGLGSCEGCSAPACIVLRGVQFQDSGSPPYANVPALPGQDILVWQSNTADCLITPVRNRTWGAIKALFR